MVFIHDFQKYPELTNKQMEEFQLTSPHTQITEDFNAALNPPGGAVILYL